MIKSLINKVKVRAWELIRKDVKPKIERTIFVRKLDKDVNTKVGYVYRVEDLVNIVSSHLKNKDVSYIVVSISKCIYNTEIKVYIPEISDSKLLQSISDDLSSATTNDNKVFLVVELTFKEEFKVSSESTLILPKD